MKRGKIGGTCIGFEVEQVLTLADGSYAESNGRGSLRAKGWLTNWGKHD